MGGGRSHPTELLQVCPLWPSGADRGIFQGSCNGLVIIAPHGPGPHGVGGWEALVWTLNLLSEILDAVPGVALAGVLLGQTPHLAVLTFLNRQGRRWVRDGQGPSWL